ncbi:MAG: ADP-glyceromanno-heptose 6-epimerase, partial [Gammaproteobacteria bacterium]
GDIEYIPFPDDLHAAYQAYTEADLGTLRAAGYGADFLGIEDGVERYLEWLPPI